MTKTQPLTTREVAEKLETDPRTLRRFLRAKEKGVGAGKRYEFGGRDIAPLKKAFNSWLKEQEKPSKGKLPAADRGMELTDEERADFARADTEG